MSQKGFAIRKHIIRHTFSPKSDSMILKLLEIIKIVFLIIYFLSYVSNLIVKVKVAQSCPTLYDPWTIQFLKFSRPEYWSGQPFPSPGTFYMSLD